MIPVFAAVFLVMTALWCALAWWLVRHPLAGAAMRRRGHELLPFVLIGLGLVILSNPRLLLA
jgi:cadmium resistance protein CadD (predicted permease)